MLVEPGRVCIKKYGRDAGSRAVITRVIDKNFVSIVTTIRNKERRCNTNHLEFLNETVDIKDKDTLNRVLGVEAKEHKVREPSTTVQKKKK